MEMWVNDSAVWKKALEIWVNDSAVWKQAKEIWVNDSGVWKQAFTSSGPLSLNSFTPSAPSGSCIYFGASCSSNVNVTVNFTGGAGSPTFSWTYVSGVVFNIASAASQTANFEHTGGLLNNIGVYKCTITDGAEVVNSNVTITLKHVNGN